MNNNTAREVYFPIVDQVMDATGWRWDQLALLDPRERPAISGPNNIVWQDPNTDADGISIEDVCGYATHVPVPADQDTEIVLPSCEWNPECPCAFTAKYLDNSSTKEQQNSAYWQERMVAPTGGFRCLTNEEYCNLTQPDLLEMELFGDGSYVPRDQTQFGIHLRSHALFRLHEIKLQIWKYEDQVHREIIAETYNWLKDGGQGRIEALLSDPQFLITSYIDYFNNKIENMCRTLLNRHQTDIENCFADIEQWENEYNLQHRLFQLQQNE